MHGIRRTDSFGNMHPATYAKKGISENRPLKGARDKNSPLNGNLVRVLPVRVRTLLGVLT